ncbi:MAG: hypothetical protein ACYCV4_02510 [Dermatophilaceae bacterium]
MAPAATAPQQANPTQQSIATFLAYARTRAYPTLAGTIASGATGGGASSQVAWIPADIPDVAAYAETLDLFCTLPITLTLPASSSVVVSPYAPYSVLQNYFTVAGQSQWEYMSGVPFWLDELTSYSWFDPLMSYPSSYGAISGQSDNGASQTTGAAWYPNGDGSGAFQPGATISNTASTQTTVSGTLQFRIRIRLRRRQANLQGMVPLGDPENRPQLFAQLSALVGTKPADNLFISTTGTTAPTAALSATGNVWAVFNSKSLDLLPAGIAAPTPAVQMAMQVNTVGSVSIPQAGTIIRVPHRTAMVYDKIFHILYNNQIAQAADYFGLWTTDDQQTARWSFDSAENSYQEYFEKLHDTYKRYFPKGCLIADLYSGKNPEFPASDPYHGEMSPDSGYAAIAGTRVTPAMNTAFRIPSGTTLTSPGIQVYSLGRVTCSY